MAVPVWPSTVPHQSEAEGSTASASFTPPAVFKTNAGPSIKRPRPGPRVTTMSWRSIPLTGVQWAALDEFLRVTLHDGTLVFDMPVYRPDLGYVLRKCEIAEGTLSSDFSAPPWTRVAFTRLVYNW
ncbi:hypothetical protein SAMN04515666_11917 [Bosea lupini]|uniref:Uncharacterized protein n=1 Tax=Bosea lupini TaxID=1036779 RepID=A0A1H8AGV9_9HYPH|nr:hypothetical protein [Bosea lupini]SEM68757.1 hypothetical protein SAMN04515666_11917 [Bosea lupini]